jgi:hypothetical protein
VAPAGLHAILQSSDSRGFGAVSAAEELTIRLQSVANDLDAAPGALRGNLRDRTLEAIERVRAPIVRDLQRLVVLVSATLTLRHNPLLLQLLRNAPLRSQKQQTRCQVWIEAKSLPCSTAASAEFIYARLESM